MNFGYIDNCILFGGGWLLYEIAKISKQSFSTLIVTSPRQITEQISGSTLEKLVSGFKVLVWEKLDRYLLTQLVTKNTLGVSIGTPWLFKKSDIDLFGGRFVNLHGTNLPQDRGAGGFSWRIMRDDKKGSAVIHQMAEGLDTGDIFKKMNYVFPIDARRPADYEKIAVQQYISLFCEFCDEIKMQKDFVNIHQQNDLSTYWPRLSTDINGFIDWSWHVKDIERFICAFDAPYAGASTFINGTRVRLHSCFVEDGYFHPFQFGLIYRISDGLTYIAANGGSLIVSQIDNCVPKEGDRLYTPSDVLDNAKCNRIKYDSKGIKV